MRFIYRVFIHKNVKFINKIIKSEGEGKQSFYERNVYIAFSIKILIKKKPLKIWNYMYFFIYF